MMLAVSCGYDLRAAGRVRLCVTLIIRSGCGNAEHVSVVKLSRRLRILRVRKGALFQRLAGRIHNSPANIISSFPPRRHLSDLTSTCPTLSKHCRSRRHTTTHPSVGTLLETGALRNHRRLSTRPPRPARVIEHQAQPTTAPQQQNAVAASLAKSACAIPRRREKKKQNKANDADLMKRLQGICKDADPTRLYRNLLKIGQG